MAYKLVALMGPGGSGKDTILRALIDTYPAHFNKIISCTTRPPREGEKNGLDYYFLSEDEFLKKISNGDMLENTMFNGWRYGTERTTLSEDKINAGIYSPAGINSLAKEKDIELYVYYVIVYDKVRLLRQLNRETYPNVSEIIRRFIADEKDFRHVGDYVNVDYRTLLNSREEDIAISVDDIFNQICL